MVIILVVLLPFFAIGQQVEFAGGVHIGDGGFKNFAFVNGERTKTVWGLGVKQIAGNWGIYANWYSSKKRLYSDSIIIYRPTFGDAVDSLVYEHNLMPFGFTLGVSYTFPFRLSAFVGVGLSIFRNVHASYKYDCFPTPTGFYSPYKSEYSEKYFETSRKICFELIVDYDCLKSISWALGPRIGFNTQNKFISQMYFGYNLNQD